MCYLEDIFGAAAGESPEAFIVEAESVPRWANGQRPFLPSQVVRSELLDSFLRRTLPAGEHARLDQGEIVELQTEIAGARWQLKAQSVSGCLQLSANPIFADQQGKAAQPSLLVRQNSAAMAYAPELSNLDPKSEPRTDLCPPPRVLASNQHFAPGEGVEDRFEQMLLDPPDKRMSGPREGSEARLGDRRARAASELRSLEPGVPGFVEDLPYGLATGPLPLARGESQACALRFDPERTLIFVSQSEVLEAALTHLADPAIVVGNESSVFDSYSAIDSLKPRTCVVVDVEDPSQWFAWVMRRLEQGCTVLVLCRATSEIGALRIFCGLHPELPCSRWLAEHRRVFLSSLESVTSLFLSDSKAAVASF